LKAVRFRLRVHIKTSFKHYLNMPKYKVGTLFSGHCDGFALAAEWAGMECVWQVEINPSAHVYLRKNFPLAKKHYDIRNTGKHNLTPVDIILGGPPCQPASFAGKQLGADDERWLWNEWFRVIGELRPSWCIAENVAGITSVPLRLRDTEMGYPEGSPQDYDSALHVFKEWYEEIGYRTLYLNIPAAACGAPHERQRIWIVAYRGEDRRQSWDTPPHGWEEYFEEGRRVWPYAHTGCEFFENTDGSGREGGQSAAGTCGTTDSSSDEVLQHAHVQRCEEHDNSATQKDGSKRQPEFGHNELWRNWSAESGVLPLADGISNRLAQIEGYSLAVVPQIPFIILSFIKQIMDSQTQISNIK
jgi:DNA-cytosine methyltransferase